MARAIEQYAEEYRQLRKTKNVVEARMAALKDILLKHQDKSGHIAGDLKVQERDLTTFDENRVWELMDRYAIPHSEFTVKTVAPSLVEQLYYEGRISDVDLRYIREPKYAYALVDDNMPEEVVPDL